MICKFRAWSPGQSWLLPPSPPDWLPENHLVYFLLDVSEQVDLSPILQAYRGDQGGQPPFHPRLMLVLLCKLGTKRGPAEYARRKAIIEPIFGQIKHCRGFRQFLLRGLRKMKAEWKLICLTHNLLKLFRSGALVMS